MLIDNRDISKQSGKDVNICEGVITSDLCKLSNTFLYLKSILGRRISECESV